MTLMCSIGWAQLEGTPSSTFPKPSETMDEWRPHVGLIAGIANHEGSTFDSAFEYGVDVGFQPYVPFGLGLELSTATSEVDVGIFDEELVRTKLLAKGTYNFGGGIPVIKHSYVGLAIGPMLESLAGDDELYIGTAPMLGFDIPLREKSHDYLSLGLNARYLISSSGSPDAFTVNGMMKYWF